MVFFLAIGGLATGESQMKQPRTARERQSFQVVAPGQDISQLIRSLVDFDRHTPIEVNPAEAISVHGRDRPQRDASPKIEGLEPLWKDSVDRRESLASPDIETLQDWG